ncbi:pseudouridylate synthase 7 homolog isoform X1 [Pelobates cultripes]|uniref:Pseudouridylate synthase PUS7L n=1 Tax=Pelobates cultripes TaxID=61616 RepID=A0AAD1RTT3_PELCU|nr:pseudouridylate synthase 7 homolog isoform X1 [Pelobates cultripes]
MEKEAPYYTFLDTLCYISDHIGFYGTIKNSPADFVVTEIDESGELVTRDSSKETEEQMQASSNEMTTGQNNVKKQRTNLRDLHDSRAGVSGSISDLSEVASEEMKDFTSNALHYHFNVTVLDSLNHFADSIKSAWKAQLSEADHQELSLGLFPEKSERANIHSAVRQTFPFLITFTKSTELLVKPNLDYQELCQLTSEEEADDFFTFLDAKVENSRFTFQPDSCKEHRTRVHHFINKKFGKLLETKSFSEKDNGLQMATITVRFRERKCPSIKRHRTEEVDKHSVYTAFTLQKENLETLEAISYLSTLLGILPSDFSYAGIKDKKAITYQTMVVKKVSPESLRTVESSIRRKGMKMYNIHPVTQPLRLGQLTGNHFSIVVRDVSNHSDDSLTDVQLRIEEAICNVKMNGFINYYGPQRFGKGQAHEIGLSLLKEEMERAVKLLFTPDAAEDSVNKAKKYFVETGDAKGSLALMPNYKVRERMLLRALHRYGMNHEGCIRGWLCIPHSMRIFYIHAYCSKVWNEAACFRVKSYGAKVVEGDLVIREQNASEKSSLSDRVHVVTAAEEEAKTYTMSQVVLPMPGHSVTYPANKVGQWYRDALAKDGLQTCKFRVGSLQLNLPGCYRQIFKYPLKLAYELSLGSQHEEKEVTTGTEIVALPKPHLTLTLDLESSCYATVCLREMMKFNF